MANARVTDIDFRIQADTPHRGEECTVGFTWQGGSSGFSTDLARASAIMKSARYADELQYDPQDKSLHIVIRTT